MRMSNQWSEKRPSNIEQVKLKEMRHNKQKLEQNFKKAFYQSLQQQLEKKLDKVNQQNKTIIKQRNLFDIYGASRL